MVEGDRSIVNKCDVNFFVKNQTFPYSKSLIYLYDRIFY